MTNSNRLRPSNLVVGIEAEHLQGGAVGEDDFSLALDDDGAGRVLDKTAVARFALLQAAVHLGQRGQCGVEGAAALLDLPLHLPAAVEGIHDKTGHHEGEQEAEGSARVAVGVVDRERAGHGRGGDLPAAATHGNGAVLGEGRRRLGRLRSRIELLLAGGRTQIRDRESNAGAGAMLFHHIAEPQDAQGKAQQLLAERTAGDGRPGAR